MTKPILNAEDKLYKIQQECRLVIKDCKMCKYYNPKDVSTCNDEKCQMIGAVAQARRFLDIIKE